jgi:hypothetical protein
MSGWMSLLPRRVYKHYIVVNWYHHWIPESEYQEFMYDVYGGRNLFRNMREYYAKFRTSGEKHVWLKYAFVLMKIIIIDPLHWLINF